ncbi:MAG: hypothetical protein BMS9Abin11_0706 [Gammaproteobacteria bacterium]|nr:MAG: hypothetical protein BMS9Abin11_0706 [Gammaproteobacteria bacterium]
MIISPGSTHRGIVEWLLQRLSAVYLTGFVVFVALKLILSPLSTFTAWQAWFYSDAVRLANALFLLCLLLHTWIGLRSVYIDYLRHTALRMAALLLTALGLLAAGFWGIGLLIGAAS